MKKIATEANDGLAAEEMDMVIPLLADICCRGGRLEAMTMGCGFEWNWWSCVGVGVGGGCWLLVW